MTYVVTDNCVRCRFTNCAAVCPADAFYEGPDMLFINPDSCINCNLCVSECPVKAIYSDTDLPETEEFQRYLEVNAKGVQDYNDKIIQSANDVFIPKAPLPTARARLLEIEALQGPMPEARKILERLVI